MCDSSTIFEQVNGMRCEVAAEGSLPFTPRAVHKYITEKRKKERKKKYKTYKKKLREQY